MQLDSLLFKLFQSWSTIQTKLTAELFVLPVRLHVSNIILQVDKKIEVFFASFVEFWCRLHHGFASFLFALGW